jgi:hypothetical protein
MAERHRERAIPAIIRIIAARLGGHRPVGTVAIPLATDPCLSSLQPWHAPARWRKDAPQAPAPKIMAESMKIKRND